MPKAVAASKNTKAAKSKMISELPSKIMFKNKFIPVTSRAENI